MIKRSDGNPDEPSPGLAKLIAPRHIPVFDRWGELTARFDLLNNSDLGRSLKWFEGLNSSLVQALRLNSPLTDTFKQMERLKLPSIQALKWIEGLNSPLMQALKVSSPLSTATLCDGEMRVSGHTRWWIAREVHHGS